MPEHKLATSRQELWNKYRKSEIAKGTTVEDLAKMRKAFMFGLCYGAQAMFCTDDRAERILGVDDAMFAKEVYEDHTDLEVYKLAKEVHRHA